MDKNTRFMEHDGSPPPNAVAKMKVRPRALAPKDFLIFVPGRGAGEFRASFARWLAEVCPVELVRRCFDAEPERQVTAWRKELFPARWQKLLDRAAGEKDLARRRALFAEMDRILPQSKRDAFMQELQRRRVTFTGEYVNGLVKALEVKDSAAQIRFLNRHLKRRNLLPPSPKRDPAAARRALSAVPIKFQPPRSISLEEVEDAYYYCHPELRPDLAGTEDLTFSRELGGDLARSFARLGIPGEPFALKALAHELAVLPELGNAPSPVWAALCGQRKGKRYRASSLRQLLKAELERDAKALRDLAAALLCEHLRSLTRLQLGRFANTRRLANASREAVKRLAGTDASRAVNYRAIHRATRYNGGVVRALEFFFFHGPLSDDLRTRPGLLAKLLPTLENADIPLLLKFLFQTGKKKHGLVQRWCDDDALRSPFRNKLVLVQRWPWLVQRHRAGKPETQSFEAVEALAGELTVEEKIAREPDIAAKQGGSPGEQEQMRRLHLSSSREEERAKRRQTFEKRRERLGLHYPK